MTTISMNRETPEHGTVVPLRPARRRRLPTGIAAWPERERPREKLAVHGVDALSNAELLALVLRVGVRGQSSVDLGRTLLNRFGTLHTLLDAPAAQLTAVPGIGPAKVAQLKAIAALVGRALDEQLRENPPLETPAAVRRYLRLQIGSREQETFFCLYLDARSRLISGEEASCGTLTHTSVYPREIARRALALNAASLIVAHNHPSGRAQPSAADKLLTRQLQATMALIEVRLLDHFVVTKVDVFSFAEQGLL